MDSMKLVELILAGIGLLILNLAYVFQTGKLYRSKHTIGINNTAYLINFIGRWGFAIYGAMVSGTVGLAILVGQGCVGIMSVPIIYYGWRNKGTEGKYIKADFRMDLLILRVALKMISVAIIIVGLLMRPEIDVIHFKLVGPAIKWVPFGVSVVFSCFTGLSFLPQTIQVLKTRKTHSLSLLMLILFVIGNSLMIIGLIVSAIDNKDAISYTASIILTCVAVGSMAIVLPIKIKNVKKAAAKDPNYQIT